MIHIRITPLYWHLRPHADATFLCLGIQMTAKKTASTQKCGSCFFYNQRRSSMPRYYSLTSRMIPSGVCSWF